MRNRALAAGVLIALIAGIPVLAAPKKNQQPANPKKPAAPKNSAEVVIKYGGSTAKDTTATGTYMVFQGEAMPSGQVFTFQVGNAAEKKYSPEPKVANALSSFKAGDLIDIMCVIPNKANANPNLPFPVEALKPYKLHPGEDQPNGYVFSESFQHKTGDVTISEITLTKYKQKYTFKIPSHPDAQGDLLADDVLTGISNKLKANQSVYAIGSGIGNDQTIKLLGPWARVTGKFVKLDASVAVDTTNDTGPAVELVNPKGVTITALIPGAVMGKKWIPNSDVLDAVRSLKPDEDVDYRTADSGDKRVWLESIEKPKPVTSAMKTNSTTKPAMN